MRIADWCLKHSATSALLSDFAFRYTSEYEFPLSELFLPIANHLRSVRQKKLPSMPENVTAVSCNSAVLISTDFQAQMFLSVLVSSVF